MKLDFVIDESYLIYHTLKSIEPEMFSSNLYKKDIIAFQDYAWNKSQKCYNFLIGRHSPWDLTVSNIKNLSKELNLFIKNIKKSKYYKKIFLQTQRYLKFCKRQWSKNHTMAIKLLNELTDFDFNKTFIVYITHPSLKNGRYLGDNRIVWGHKEEWPNYTTVYLCHEMLHSYFDHTPISHSIIELISDEELRARLNKGKYPPFIGHNSLVKLKNKILPYWKKYVKKGSKDIRGFIRSYQS